MKKVEIIVRANHSDNYSVGEESGLNPIEIFSFTENVQSDYLSHNIKSTLLNSGLFPSESMSDFLNLSLAAYTIDQIVPRSSFGYLGWNRYLKIHLPVYNLEIWKEIKTDLVEMLSFLSGDKWELEFRKREFYDIEYDSMEVKHDTVSLFSGGLDSYTGAINFLNEGRKVALIGHHKQGTEEKSVQQGLIKSLQEKFGEDKVLSFFFFVQAKSNKEIGFSGEMSQRARSILFIGLGLAIANASEGSLNLNVPENGLISLNIPLTKSRMGSLSTRTTHPYFFYLLNKNLKKLEINNSVVNPYQFLTKGEMLESCKDKKFLNQTLHRTVSCSKPKYYIRWKNKDEIHCGHCTPCIIRRAAMHRVGVDDAKKYVHDIKKNPPQLKEAMGRDTNAFKAAIQRINGKKISLLNIAQSGPLMGEAKKLNELKRVYENGMQEVHEFFKTK